MAIKNTAKANTDRQQRATREIVTTLWSISEQYHAGSIDHDEFGRRNVQQWHAAELCGVVADVRAMLRTAH